MAKRIAKVNPLSTGYTRAELLAIANKVNRKGHNIGQQLLWDLAVDSIEDKAVLQQLVNAGPGDVDNVIAQVLKHGKRTAGGREIPMSWLPKATDINTLSKPKSLKPVAGASAEGREAARAAGIPEDVIDELSMPSGRLTVGDLHEPPKKGRPRKYRTVGSTTAKVAPLPTEAALQYQPGMKAKKKVVTAESILQEHGTTKQQAAAQRKAAKLARVLGVQPEQVQAKPQKTVRVNVKPGVPAQVPTAIILRDPEGYAVRNAQPKSAVRAVETGLARTAQQALVEAPSTVRIGGAPAEGFEGFAEQQRLDGRQALPGRIGVKNTATRRALPAAVAAVGGTPPVPPSTAGDVVGVAAKKGLPKALARGLTALPVIGEVIGAGLLAAEMYDMTVGRDQRMRESLVAARQIGSSIREQAAAELRLNSVNRMLSEMEHGQTVLNDWQSRAGMEMVEREQRLIRNNGPKLATMATLSRPSPLEMSARLRALAL